MFYKVEYKLERSPQSDLAFNSCYVMIEAKDEEHLKKMIDKDILESKSSNTPIIDADIFLITPEEYLNEQKNHLEAIIMNEYLKSLSDEERKEIPNLNDFLRSDEAKGKAYHLYLNKIVAGSFIASRINLDDIAASSYLSYKERLGLAISTDDYEAVMEEILNS